MISPNPQTDATESLRDGTQAAVEIRRQLLRPTPDVRALFKITALLAKVMLRFEGIDRAADDDALRVLLGPQRITAGLLARARGDREAAEQLALEVLGAWLGELPTPSEEDK